MQRPTYEADPTSGPIAPLYPQAVILPIVGFPAWILCIAPMYWHFSQRNVAAGSLILWTVLNNFFNSVNPLLWPRDNLLEWWDGKVWCDINVRAQIGASVGLAACTVMILRKLAKVMDTRNITVSSSRNSKIKETVLEVVWCWGYPLVLIIVYWVIQPVRYMLVGIVGCISAFDTSWPSMVLNFMWGPITMLVATYYAILLVYRLYRYRREFNRLISARNTTKSRFLRLFVICMFVILIYLPWSFWVLVNLSTAVRDPFDWNDVHGPKHNSILKIPAFGQVQLEKWVQVATGYVFFFVFGTGTDSHNLYKKMLLAFGLGKFFPSLCIMRESGSTTPRSFIVAKTWGSSLSSRAKSMLFFKASTTEDTIGSSARNNSAQLDSITSLQPVTTEDTLLKKPQIAHEQQSLTKPSFFKRIFPHNYYRDSILPLFVRRDIAEITATYPTGPRSTSPGVHAHAWAAELPAGSRNSETNGVHVIREVYQDRRVRDVDVQKRKSAEAWA